VPTRVVAVFSFCSLWIIFSSSALIQTDRSIWVATLAAATRIRGSPCVGSSTPAAGVAASRHGKGPGDVSRAAGGGVAQVACWVGVLHSGGCYRLVRGCARRTCWHGSVLVRCDSIKINSRKKGFFFDSDCCSARQTRSARSLLLRWLVLPAGCVLCAACVRTCAVCCVCCVMCACYYSVHPYMYAAAGRCWAAGGLLAAAQGRV
jgi:hypothetical protein